MVFFVTSPDRALAHGVANAVLFQCTWFACVLGGTVWGFAALVTLTVATLSHGSARLELPVAFGLGAFGWLIDSVWVVVGILSYDARTAPMWLGFLWFAVALTINHSLRSLQARPLLGGLLAGGTAPLSYLGAEALGAVTVESMRGVVLIATTWTVLFASLFGWAAGRTRGYGATQEGKPM